MFFKGYVLTKNKRCIEKFKGRDDLKTYDEVQPHPEFAGVLDDGAVLIDIDDFDQSEAMLKIVEAQNLSCRVYETSRGKHFLFSDGGLARNRTKAALAVGLTADVKLGKRNSYEVLKLGNKERKILREAEGGKAAQLPKWLSPIRGKPAFLGMDAGDGRNQALFNYILTLQSEDFTTEEARTCIRLINKFVLKTPLPDGELEVVLRDEAFQKNPKEKGAFSHDKFALHLKGKLHVAKIEGQLHFYCEGKGIYISGQKRFGAEMLRELPHLTSAKRSEVYKYLDEMIVDSAATAEADLIAFRNGLYSVSGDGLAPFSPEHVLLNRIEWDYNPTAYDGLVDEVLDRVSCHDGQIRTLLEEVAGYCLYRRNELGKAFVLTGEKANGKSTFLGMVKAMLGESNVSALDLAELGERFSTAELFGRLANIGDDIGDEFIPNTGAFKKLVTGEMIKGERKGQDPFFFHSYAKLLFSANSVPRLGKGKDSAAIARRLIIIPFEAQFTKDDPGFKPFIKYELQSQSAMEYLAILGLRGLKRVLANKGFSQSEKAQAALSEYEEANNPILGFFRGIEPGEILNEPTSKVYRLYRDHCFHGNLQPLSNIEFSRQAKRHFSVDIADRKIKGTKYRIFVEKF
jgi:putative DNA primase/helicase